MFNPLFDDLEQMERLAAEVIPALGLTRRCAVTQRGPASH